MAYLRSRSLPHILAILAIDRVIHWAQLVDNAPLDNWLDRFF